MDRALIAVDKLNAWYQSQDRDSVQSYIKADGDLNKGNVARDAGFGRKALTDSVNGNPRLQARYEEIVSEMQEKKWLLVEFNDTTSREHINDIASEAIQKELEKTRRHIAELESKLAKANAKIAQIELQFSQLSEMREVMIELGFPTR
ncbi:hypothetical protein FJ444_20835 [Aestuariibacter sp. GS-14]|uniref:hypothetical protein n=1 Tax=Aestuariibacter sp. GS-14 TaxID=2590670 RepID=UPI00112A6FEE|nr:hypothetical protein [Aestuariibacter sp. GS-14]TPV52898.1 hypothetical protein FJ444_20835 [Aestuariibacter sp. GS-14]